MSPRTRRTSERNLIIVAAALLGALLAAAPTGIRGFDVLWSAALGALLAYAGAYSSPLTLLPAATIVALLSGRWQGLVLAALAMAVTGATALKDRPSSRLTAGAGGLLALALLQRGPGSTLSVLGGDGLVVLLVVGSGFRGLSRRRRRRVYVVAGAIAGVTLLLGLAGGLAGLRAKGEAERGIDALRAARESATSGDLDAAVDGFQEAERAFRTAGEALGTYGRLGRVIPGLSQQLGAARTAVDTAADTSQALREAGSAIHLDDVPVEGGTIDLAAVAATEGPLEIAVESLDRTVTRLSRIDPDPLLPPIRDALADALEEARGAASTVNRAHRAVQELPPLLGADGPTRLLVLFTSGVEARNRFGFPGAYAVIRFDDGKLSFEQAGPMDDIDPDGTFNQAELLVPPRAATFSYFGVSENWRQVTLPSDGPTVADLALQMAAQVGLGPLDGLVLADPATLAEMVRLTGDVEIPDLGFTLTPQNTVDFIVRDQYLAFPEQNQRADRKDALGLVAAVVGDRLGSLSLPHVRDLVDRFGPLVEDGHLVVAVPTQLRPSAAELFADLGLDGGFVPSEADVLQIGHINSAGNKIDLYLQRTIDYEVEIGQDGQLNSTLTIELENQAPSSGLPDYVIGSALQPPPPTGTNITTLLIYSRQALQTISVDGAPLMPQTIVDGGFLLYEVSMELAPGQTRRIDATLRGPAALDGYALDVLPNGLVLPDDLSIRVADARSGDTAAWSGPNVSRMCVRTNSEGVDCDNSATP